MAASRPEQPKPIFPQLSGRGRTLGPERVAAHQRGRLEGAMVEAVARDGYGKVTVNQLVALAGVSKSAFYREFAGKEECFWATFETILVAAGERVVAASEGQEGFPERLAASARALVELIAEQPGAAHLAAVDSLSLGTAAVAPRERGAAMLEALLARGFAEDPRAGEVSELNVRGIIGGLREVVYRRLATGELERLDSDIGTLVEWVLSFGDGATKGPASPGARLVKAVGPVEITLPDGEQLPWSEPANSPRSRKTLSQRERIMRASAQVAAAKGYGKLGVAAISAQAGTSNATFYENFASKEEAFLAAFDALGQRLVGVAARALGERKGPFEAGTAGLLALLSHFATDSLLRKLAFFELAAAGPPALWRAEATLNVLMGFMEPDVLPPEATVRPPRVVIEATAGGMWGIVQHEVSAGRAESLPELAPQLIDFALVPFGVE